jgi:hypothetical protein
MKLHQVSGVYPTVKDALCSNYGSAAIDAKIDVNDSIKSLMK